MTTNKIPTDKELLEQWKDKDRKKPFNKATYGDYIHEYSVLALLGEARAAGRAEGAAEQREKDAESIRTVDRCLWHHVSAMLRFDELRILAEAIQSGKSLAEIVDSKFYDESMNDEAPTNQEGVARQEGEE